MAAMTLEGLDDEPHQERRSGAHASSLAFAFVLGIIAGQALPCGNLSFDGHDYSSARAESVVNTDDYNCLAYFVDNSPNCCSVHPIHFGVTTLPRTLRFTVTSPGYGLVDQRARVTPDCSAKPVGSSLKALRERSKHFELRFLKIQEYAERGMIRMVQVPTKFQLADMLTKRLDPGNHQRLRRMILGHDSFDHRRYFAESNN